MSLSTTGNDEYHGLKTEESIGGMKVSHSMLVSISVMWIASQPGALRASL